MTEKTLAISLAKKAGALLLKGFVSQTRPPDHRHEKDLSTQWDKAAEKIIIAGIKKAFPDDALLTEETGRIAGRPDHLWLIDPLDGTGNFTRRNPLFTVSIALIVKSQLKLGIVYAPVTKELFVAERGRGAALNSEAIHVSNTAKLDTAFLVSCAGAERDRERYARLYGHALRHVVDVRKLGSAALECSYVAAGRADGYFTTKIEPWDVAAGILLVQEAGGTVTDFSGRPWLAKQTDLVASNSRLHSAILKLVQ